MPRRAQHRQPWDWRGQLIQLALIVVVVSVAGLIAYACAVVTAHLVGGWPPPVPDGWRNITVTTVALTTFIGLSMPGMIWINSYLRKHRGRLL